MLVLEEVVLRIQLVLFHSLSLLMEPVLLGITVPLAPSCLFSVLKEPTVARQVFRLTQHVLLVLLVSTATKKDSLLQSRLALLDFSVSLDLPILSLLMERKEDHVVRAIIVQQARFKKSLAAEVPMSLEMAHLNVNNVQKAITVHHKPLHHWNALSTSIVLLVLQ